MADKRISDISAGDEIQGFYLIKECSPRVSSGNKLYLDLQLMDSTGDINAKFWEAQDSDVQTYVSGTIVKIKGTVQLFQNKLQVRISKIRESNEADGVRTQDYVASAPWDASWMLEQIEAVIVSLESEDLKKLCLAFIDLYREKLLFYPAAKSNHHAIRSGLLYHILRMMQSGERLLTVYTSLNRDLLLTGVLLHDIAKIDEMDAGELGVVTAYTVPGQLLGHLIQGVTLVDRLGRELGLNPELLLLVEHMILTHHYEPEFGSPKKPSIPEGELLHYLDMIDARMYDMENALSSVAMGSFSEPVWSLDRRRLYRPGV